VTRWNVIFITFNYWGT